MSLQILAGSPTGNKKQPLLSSEEITSSAIKTPPPPMASGKKRGKKVGEMVGGSAAECAAVCCCCPCAVLDLLLLAVFRAPTAVCKKVWRCKKRRRIMRKKRQGLLVEVPEGEIEESRKGRRVVAGDLTAEMEIYKNGGETEAVDFDKEMLDRFYGTGFWRSPSQREA